MHRNSAFAALHRGSWSSGPDRFWDVPSAFADTLFGSQLLVVQTGYGSWGKHHCARHRGRPVLAIELITAGEMTFVQDGRSFLLRQGDVALLHRNTSILVKTGPCGFMHKRMALFIGAELLDSALMSFGLSDVDVVHLNSPDILIRLLKDIRNEIQQATSSSSATLSSLGYRVLVELGRAQHEKDIPPQLQTVVDYIKRHSRGRVSVGQLTTVSGMSRSTLYREFDRAFGCSPLDFFFRAKINYAKFLLRTSDVTIKQIAQVLGYNDAKYFARQFTQQTGKSPRAFRKEDGR